MQHSDLEHLIRACGEIAGDNEILIIGSQSILGQFPNAPVALLASMEADIFPKNFPARADKIDGAIGEGSSFHELHGYYAQGVSEQTAVLPKDWRSRLIGINNENTNGVTGWCLEIHDLAVSKLVAHRPKDLDFIQQLVRHDMIGRKIMLDRLNETDLPKDVRKNVMGTIKSTFAT